MWIWGYFHAETPTGGLPTNFETIPSRFSSFFFRRTPVRFSYTTWLRILSLAFIPLSGLNLCESPALNKLRIIPGLWTIPGPRQSVGNMHWSRTQPAAGATEKIRVWGVVWWRLQRWESPSPDFHFHSCTENPVQISIPRLREKHVFIPRLREKHVFIPRIWEDPPTLGRGLETYY